MILAVPAIARTTAVPVVTVPDPAPPPVTFITLSGASVDWSGYVPPADFAGYDVRYTTVLGQSWASAFDLAPGLQIQTSVLVAAFPAGAVECLVVPVDAGGHVGFPEARQALVVVTPPPPVTVIALQADRVAWTYAPPADFAGYDVRYTTVLGGGYATATRLRTATQAFALLSDFPAAALECLVEPVNTGGAYGTPEARQGGLHPAANPYALGPDYTAGWTAQPGGAGVTIVQEATSVVVDGGTDDTSTAAFMTLWGKTALPAGRDWTFKARLTQLDAKVATQSDGIFLQVVTATGGVAGSDANPNKWTTAQYQDGTLTYKSTSGVYDKYSTGWRFSFDQDALVTANSDQLRGHSFTGGTETVLDAGGSSGVAFPFAPNVAYDVTLQWRSGANTLTWTLAHADGTGAPVVVPVVDAGIGTFMGGYLGLNVSPGRKARVENPVLTDDGAGSGGGTPPPTGEAWRDDTTQWAQILPLAQVSASIIVPINSNADLPLMAAANAAGKHFVIGANVTGSITVTAHASQANPTVIRGAYDGTDPTQFPRWTGNQSLTISGASHVYITKLTFVGTSNTSSSGQVAITNGATRISIERCWSYGQSNSGDLYNCPPYRCDGSNIRFFRIRYCEHGNASVTTQAGMWTLGNPDSATVYPQFLYFYRNLAHHRDDSAIPASAAYGGVIFSIGRGEQSSDTDNKAAFYENRCRDITGPRGEGMEMKNSGAVLAYNTLEAAANGNAFTMRFRHGHNASMIGNLFIDSASGTTAGLIQVRGSGHTIVNNWAVQLAAGAAITASSPNGGSNLVLWGGNIDGSVPLELVKAEQSPPRPNSIACLVGGNRMAVIVGNPDPGGGTPLGSVVNVVGPAAGGGATYRNRSWSIGGDGDQDYYGRGKSRAQYGAGTTPSYGTTFGGSTTITNRAITGADYDKVPTRLFDSDVGVACTVYP